jgi:hypothetical protein
MQRKLKMTPTQVQLLAAVDEEIAAAQQRRTIVIAAYLASIDVELASDVVIDGDTLIVEDDDVLELGVG